MSDLKFPIYLDYSSTSPCDPRVAAKMAECLTLEANFGNPASRSHFFGWKAEEAVETARREVASLLNCDPKKLSGLLVLQSLTILPLKVWHISIVKKVSTS